MLAAAADDGLSLWSRNDDSLVGGNEADCNFTSSVGKFFQPSHLRFSQMLTTRCRATCFSERKNAVTSFGPTRRVWAAGLILSAPLGVAPLVHRKRLCSKDHIRRKLCREALGVFLVTVVRPVVGRARIRDALWKELTMQIDGARVTHILQNVQPVRALPHAEREASY